MVKPNSQGGKKFKRNKKGNNSNESEVLQLAEDGQLYAKVTKKVGGQYLEVMCSDEKSRKAYIRGALRKTVWMNADDILLVSTRDFEKEDNKCDIICKYTASQAKKLFNIGQIKFEIKEQPEQQTIWQNENNISGLTEGDEKNDGDEFNFDEI